MARAQSGDGEAYRRLLRAITPCLRALAVRGGSDLRDVEDVVQDVLLTVHAVRHTYDPARPFGPWLTAIARRRIVDRLRRARRVANRELAVDDYETFSARCFATLLLTSTISTRRRWSSSGTSRRPACSRCSVCLSDEGSSRCPGYRVRLARVRGKHKERASWLQRAAQVRNPTNMSSRCGR
ncbi:MAG TPA: sigma factor [Casimicrobiaceae bacterium]|nr:sigma factor [Casimicrobiaceae bacterium]